MVVVFLRHLPCSGVVLEDFFVGETGEEGVWVRGVEFYDMWDGGVGEASGACAGFGVPEFEGAIIGGGEEMGAWMREGDVRDGLCVASVCAEVFAGAVDVENLHFGVGAGGEEEVSG